MNTEKFINLPYNFNLDNDTPELEEFYSKTFKMIQEKLNQDLIQFASYDDLKKIRDKLKDKICFAIKYEKKQNIKLILSKIISSYYHRLPQKKESKTFSFLTEKIPNKNLYIRIVRYRAYRHASNTIKNIYQFSVIHCFQMEPNQSQNKKPISSHISVKEAKKEIDTKEKSKVQKEKIEESDQITLKDQANQQDKTKDKNFSRVIKIEISSESEEYKVENENQSLRTQILQLQDQNIGLTLEKMQLEMMLLQTQRQYIHQQMDSEQNNESEEKQKEEKKNPQKQQSYLNSKPVKRMDHCAAENASRSITLSSNLKQTTTKINNNNNNNIISSFLKPSKEKGDHRKIKQERQVNLFSELSILNSSFNVLKKEEKIYINLEEEEDQYS